MARRKVKVNVPYPEMREGYTVLRHNNRTIYRVTYKPQFVLTKPNGEIEATFNSLRKAKQFLDEQ